MGIIKKKTIVTLFSLLLFSSIFTIPASAGTGSANLKVTIIETNPYPAKIGEYLNLALQVENVGGDKATDADIAIIPEYPFSLDSQANTLKNIGVLNPGSTASKEFSLFIDKNAQKGIRSLKVRTRPSKDGQWTENKFSIRIGTETFNSKGTVELKELVSDPKVFMPGDRGTISVTLTNTATTPTVTIDGSTYDTNARIQAASLKSLSDGITVLDSPYQEMGILSPGDSIKLTFNVKVAENAPEGTHNLELAIEGNSFDYNSRNNIPLKVDSSNIKVIPSKALQMVDGRAKVEFDVANTHPNEFSSVSIKPEAKGVKFYPSEYFIGPMNPDELFTIDFDAVTDGSSSVDIGVLEKTNMSLTANYNSGINRHSNTVGNLNLTNTSEPTGSDSSALITGVLVVIFIPAAFLYYRKKKQLTGVEKITGLKIS
jgi:hypothetical protein